MHRMQMQVYSDDKQSPPLVLSFALMFVGDMPDTDYEWSYFSSNDLCHCELLRGSADNNFLLKRVHFCLQRRDLGLKTNSIFRPSRLGIEAALKTQKDSYFSGITFRQALHSNAYGVFSAQRFPGDPWNTRSCYSI